MEYPGGKNEHFRHLLFFAYNQGQKAAAAARKICEVYGEKVIAESTAQKWYKQFKNGENDLENLPRSGRPSDFNDECLIALLKDDGRQTCREMAKTMNSSSATIFRHLKSMGYSQKIGSWVPHTLNEKMKEKRLLIASQHLARHRSTRGHKKRFLYKIITGDEKWCLHVNMKQRKEWVPPGGKPKSRVKQDLHPKKTMISVWWDYEGLLHWEILAENKTVDKNLYAAQLRRVDNAIKLKRPNRKGKVILLHDNARPHVATMVKSTLRELDWEPLQHPPYSPDLAPTDFHLFRSLSNNLQGVSFDSVRNLQKWLTNFFESRPNDFWQKGIDKLVERWQQVIEKDGDYVTD